MRSGEHDIAGAEPAPEDRAPTGDSGAPAQADGAAGERRVSRTRTSAAFKSTVAGVVVLILLLVFILENTESVKIGYFGATGHLPLGVALLLAAAGGALLVALIGGARILQLRRLARRHPNR